MNKILNFWYSDQCTRQIKLLTCIATCLMIYGCSTLQSLPPAFILTSLFLGLLIHLFQYSLTKQNTKLLGTKYIPVLGNIGILGALILIILFLPHSQRWILALQVFGFSALSVFIISIHQNRERRF